jgi:hypothetical protein
LHLEFPVKALAAAAASAAATEVAYLMC